MTNLMKKNAVLFFALISGMVTAQELPYELVTDVRVPMRDGVKLAGLYSYPRNSAPVPVLFRFNSYPRVSDAETGKFVFNLTARAGYAYAEFYMRGTGKSEGEIEPFEHDARDVHDIIDWLSKQPWCNGEAGMVGGSYLGFTQWAALKYPHPALKTIVPMVAAAPGIDFPVLNGIFSSYTLQWLNFTTNGIYANDSLFDNLKHWSNLFNRYYTKGVAFNTLDSLDKNPKKIFQRWLQHPVYDRFWSDMIPSSPEEYRRINIPILTMTGYFDDDQRGAMHYYTVHNKYGAPETVKDHYLFIGPYDHYSGQGPRHMPKYHYYTFDSTAHVNKIQLNLEWHNHIFMGAPRPSILKDRVNYYLIGAGWQHGPSLEKIAKDTLSLYLYPGPKTHHLSPVEQLKTRAMLALDFNSAQATDTLTVPTEGGVVVGDEKYLLHDQQLIFDTDVMGKSFDLIGSPVANLYLQVERIKDADIQIFFYEVTAEGKSYPLSQMDQRLSHVQNEGKRNLLKSNTIYAFRLTDTYFMAKRIAKGSRIRFVIRVLNTAAYQKNYGSGKSVAAETKKDEMKGRILVLMDKKHKSSIHLPGNKNNKGM
jgi:putative CocE/NonD family hydrolase